MTSMDAVITIRCQVCGKPSTISTGNVKRELLYCNDPGGSLVITAHMPQGWQSSLSYGIICEECANSINSLVEARRNMHNENSMASSDGIKECY